MGRYKSMFNTQMRNTKLTIWIRRDPSGVTVTPPPPDSPEDPRTDWGRTKKAKANNNRKIGKPFRHKPEILIGKTSISDFSTTRLFAFRCYLGNASKSDCGGLYHQL